MQEALVRIGKNIGLDFRYFVNNGFWMGLRLGVSAVGALLLYGVFSRYASREAFGQFQMIVALVAMTSVFSLPGLNISFMRSVSRAAAGDYRDIVKKSLLWSLIGSLVLFLAGIYTLFDGRAFSVVMALFAAAVLSPFLYAPNTWEVFLIGRKHFRKLAGYFSVQTIVFLITTSLAVYFFRDNVFLAITAYYVSQSAINIWYYWLTVKTVPADEKKDPGVFSYGYFLTKIGAAETVSSNADKLLIGVLLGAESVAVYGVAVFVAVKLRELLKGFSNLLFPKLAVIDTCFIGFLFVHGRKFGAMLLLWGIVTIFYVFLIGPVMEVFFAGEYSEYVNLAQALAFSVFLFLPLTFLLSYANATGRKQSILMGGPVFSVIKIILIVVMIPMYGLMGAVWAYNIGAFVQCVVVMASILYEERKGEWSLAS